MLKHPMRTRDVPISDPKLIVYSGHTRLNVILVCKYKFVAEQDNELSVSKGDLVKFLEKMPNGWLLVKFMDKVLPPGLIPAAFVEIAVNDVKYPINMAWLTSEGQNGELESHIMRLLDTPASSPQLSHGTFAMPPQMVTSHALNSSPMIQKPPAFTRSSSVSSDPTHDSRSDRNKEAAVPTQVPSGSLEDLHTPALGYYTAKYALVAAAPDHTFSKQYGGPTPAQHSPYLSQPAAFRPQQQSQVSYSSKQKSIYNPTPPQPLAESKQLSGYQRFGHARKSPKYPSPPQRIPSEPSSEYSALSDSRSHSTSSKENPPVVSRLDADSPGPYSGLEESNDADPASIGIVNCLFYKNKFWYRVDLKYKTFKYHIIKSYQDFYALHTSLLDLNVQLPRLPEPFDVDKKKHGEGDDDFIRSLARRCQELSFYLAKLSKLHSNLVRQWLLDNTAPARGLKIPNNETKTYTNDTINQILLPNSVNLIFKKIAIKIILHNNDIISFTFNKTEIDSINYLKRVVRTRVGFKHLLIKMPDSFELVDNIDFSVIRNSDKILLRVV